MRLNRNDKAAVTACSNPPGYGTLQSLPRLADKLRKLGIEPVTGECVRTAHPTAHERADELMRFYRNKEIRAIFDISGGDLANEILEYLDYDVIRDNPKPFWGYSDLTTVLNGIYARTGSSGCLYQIRNLIGEDEEHQTEAFNNTVLEGGGELFGASWKFVQRSSAEGIAVGGNIRCLLKLAGTPYFPDMRGKLLFLESRSGREPLMRAFFAQLRQMNVLSEISGLLLGTFTEYESDPGNPPIWELARTAACRADLPIAKTQQIGHGSDSRALALGERIFLRA